MRTALIGRCGLRINPYAGMADVGYWIDGDYEGRGIVRRATHALVSMAFAELELSRVELRTSVDNTRSRGLAERLGFKFEGTVPGALRFIQRSDDVAMYCVTAADWPRIAD
jgi:ribosomal-protein-serine acetyltransferase